MSVNDIFTNSELKTIKTYAAALGLTATEYIRQRTLEQIEDKLDLQDLREAKAEAGENPSLYSWDEVKKELGL